MTDSNQQSAGKTDAERGDVSTLDIRGPDEHRERVRTMNLGGESSNIGAPVIISTGLFVDDPVEHDRLLRENPPAAMVPAQDPTPLDDGQSVPTGRVDQHAAQGGYGAVRRVDDRTPDSALPGAQEPYNLDTSAAQRSQVTGQDAAEEEAEGKRTKGGVRSRVAAEAKAEAKAQQEQQDAADKAAQDRAGDKKG